MADPTGPASGVGRVVAVGLGPAGPDLLTAGALAAIERVPSARRYLRTTRHPAAAAVGAGSSFDERYERADRFDEVYEQIAAELIDRAAADGEVLYAVPGSPRVLERTVDLLAEADARGEVELDVVAGLSFVDLAWVRLGVDPLEEGVRLVDGHRFAERAAGERGPLLVAHCHNRRVLSDIKLAVEAPPPTPVTVLQRLGLPDEAVVEVAWEDLDRSVEPDHLTSLWVPRLAAPVGAELVALEQLMVTLRERCPWDRAQTHTSLTRHLLEESYEVLDALLELDRAEQTAPDPRVAGVAGDPAVDEAYAHVEEELGDLLFQVVFHARLAAEAGRFDLADVARGIHDKLVARHPHVFAGERYDPDDPESGWEARKRAEKGRTSALDGIPSALPSLAYAGKVLKRAATVGVAVAPTPVAGPDAVGEALLGLVSAARAAGVDAEVALRVAADRLADQARRVERGAR